MAGTIPITEAPTGLDITTVGTADTTMDREADIISSNITAMVIRIADTPMDIPTDPESLPVP